MRLIARNSAKGKRPRRPTASRTKCRRRALAALVLAAAAGTGTWTAIRSGWARTHLELARQEALDATAAAGFGVREVVVRGRHATSREALLAALNIAPGMPILAVDVERALSRVESLGWVKSAAIARRLPDTIYLEIEEREPLALWQHGKRLALIDREGAVIQRHGLSGFAALPLVVGKDAAPTAAALLDLLRAYPAVAGDVEAAVRVSGRRWNLRLRNGIDVRLPANDVAAALNRLAEFQRENALFDRDVITVDLRVPDRLILRVNRDALERARAAGENT